MIAEEKRVIARANAEIQRSGRTHAELANTIRVPLESLAAALSGKRPFSVGEVVMLARALGQRAADWFEPAFEPIAVDRGKLADAFDVLTTRLRGAP